MDRLSKKITHSGTGLDQIGFVHSWVPIISEPDSLQQHIGVHKFSITCPYYGTYFTHPVDITD